MDPFYRNSPVWAQLEERQIPHYDTMEEFYAEKQAELAVICTPIRFHQRHAVYAMEHGSHVLIEKPTAATMEQSGIMEETARRTGKTLNIGFQLSYMRPILRLKQEILSGRFGKAKDAWTLVLWPRDSVYYARPWAGKMTQEGDPVLDSIAMNACAHHLHILYFLMGDAMDRSRMPEEEKVCLIRVNEIETFDTAIMEVKAGEAVIHFLVSHAVEETVPPVMKLHFEKADIFLQGEGKGEDAVKVILKDGTEEIYGSLTEDYYRKIPYVLSVVRGECRPVCTPETAKAHLLSVTKATLEGHIRDFRANLNVPDAKPQVYVKNDVRVLSGMQELLKKAFAEEIMPWEITDLYGQPEEIKL